MKLDLTYRRTASGDEALGGADSAIPVDYRRILRLIDEGTHVNVIRGCLRQYSDALIADWLAELEEIGFIESTGAGDAHELSLELPAAGSPSSGTLGELPEERRRIEAEARVVSTDLIGKGAYLATARLQNREPLTKDPAQTVVLLVDTIRQVLGQAKKVPVDGRAA